MKAELIKSLPIIALMAIAAPAIAQDTTETDTQAAPEVSMGQPVDTARQPGQTYVEKVEGDWERKCIAVPEGKGEDPCQMYQLLKDGQGNAVAEVSLGKFPAGGQAVAGATVVVPLETLLTKQLTITVDGGTGKVYPFLFCAQPGCVAKIGFTAAEVEAFKAGSQATVSIVPAAAPDQQVNLAMSLSGFTKSFDELTQPVAQQQ